MCFCLGFLVGWAESCIQQWAGLWISFPDQESMRMTPRLSRLFICCLDSSQLTVKALQPNKTTGFTLQMMNSVSQTPAWALLGYVTSRCSGQSFYSGRAGRCQKWAAGCDLASLPVWGKCLVAGPAKLFVWGPNQTDLYPAKFPDQAIPFLGSANEQRHRLRLYLSATDRNSILPRPKYWLLQASSSFCHNQIPSSWAPQKFTVSVRHDSSGGSQKKVIQNAQWAKCPPWALISYGRNCRLREASWHSSNMGEEWCSCSCSGTVATPLILTRALLVSVVPSGASASPRVLGVSQWRLTCY